MQTCLQGRRVVWLGDSVTRYQYTTLMHFLSAGHMQNPFDNGKHR